MEYKKEKKVILEIPLIEYIVDKDYPTIFFIHGIRRDKEYVEEYALMFVKKGFNVISIDAYLHGDRKLDISDSELQLKYPEIVIKTAVDVKKLIKHYNLSNEVFVVGISMGGAVSIYASTIMDTNGFVSIIGSPSMVGFLEYSSRLINVEFPSAMKNILEIVDPVENIDKLKGKRILLLNGTKDERVPASFSIELSRKLDNVDLLLYDTCHKVNSDMIKDVYKWLKTIIL